MANAGAPVLVETEDGPQLHFLGADDRGLELTSWSRTTAAGWAGGHPRHDGQRHRPRRRRLMSIDPSRYVVGPGSTVEDVDLDEEDVRLLDGRRLTSELAEKMARDGVAEARRRNLIPGGKSLGGDGSHSPRVQFRVPESLRAAAEAKAAAEGVSLSVLAREALEHYLAS